VRREGWRQGVEAEGVEGEEREAYIHDTAVDIPKLLEPEEAGSVGGIIECEALGMFVSS